MRAIRWLLLTILIVLPLVAAVHAEQPGPHWELNLEAAKRQAAQTNRLVLIHFWATWCGPCRNLEANVFTQPGVSQAIEARFVPVKVNSDDFPATAKLFAIERLPTDVIITPSGRLLYKLACPQDPTQYVAQLNQAATAAAGLLAGNAVPPGQNPNQFAQAPAIPVAPIVNPVRPATGAAQAAPPPPGLAIYSNENYSAYLNRNAPPAAPVVPAVPAAVGPQNPPAGPNFTLAAGPTTPPFARPPVSPVAAQSPTPPLGLDGFCPVTLVERARTAPQDAHCWTRGDARYGVVHRGMLYLFTGPEEQKRFMANPDRYSPVLSGNDPVLAFDHGQMQLGRREFGMFYDFNVAPNVIERRIFLFTSNESLEKFRADPIRYASEAREAESRSRPAMR